MNYTVNICVVGETSVGKTTLTSILLGKLAGIIKRSRSTLNYTCFIEDDNITDTSTEFNFENMTGEINNIFIPKLLWSETNKKYKINIMDTVGLNDIKITDCIYKKMENKIDIVIVMLDVCKGISTKCEEDIINTISNDKIKIYVCNKFDDINDEELIANYENIKNYLITNNKLSEKDNIIFMSCDTIFNILISKNEKKIKYLLMLHDLSDDEELSKNELLKIYGYENLINVINHTIETNIDKFYNNKINLIFENITNINSFYEDYMKIQNIIPTRNINYYLDNLDDELFEDESLYMDVGLCINNFDEEIIKKIVNTYVNNFYGVYNNVIELFNKVIDIFDCNDLIYKCFVDAIFDIIIKNDKGKNILNEIGYLIFLRHKLFDEKYYINKINKIINIVVKMLVEEINNNNYDNYIFTKTFILNNNDICKKFKNTQKILLIQIPESKINEYNKKVCEMNMGEGFTLYFIILLCKFIKDYDKMYLDYIFYVFIRKYTLSDKIITSEIFEIATEYRYDALKIVPKKFKTQELCEIAVKKYGYALKFVPEEFKTQELCEIAVKNDGSALKFVPEEFITRELCEFAVKNNGSALGNVPEEFKTKELCDIAVKNYGSALGNVPEEFKTKELCEIAVKNCGYALEFVPEQFKTKELCEIAVKNNGSVLRYVPEEFKTQELCEIAVKNDNYALEYVPEEFKTQELCEIPVKKYGSALRYVPEEFKTRELCIIAVNDY